MVSILALSVKACRLCQLPYRGEPLAFRASLSWTSKAQYFESCSALLSRSAAVCLPTRGRFVRKCPGGGAPAQSVGAGQVSRVICGETAGEGGNSSLVRFFSQIFQ